ncbi:MAG: PP2C family serine/threonine-protein phosphatase [Campylobacterota bacterium]|nr:PP2C family serine/threonine-protein phosphatase [Campylobacterota bacterium]
MQLEASYFTHQGDRERNEDALLIDRELIGSDALASPNDEAKAIVSKSFENHKALFALADGMGGEGNGEEASFLVLKELLDRYENLSSCESIITTIHSAKESLDNKVKEDSSRLNFGSTIAGILFLGDRAIIFNSGDSRVYRLSGAFLEQISKDHSYVQNLVDDGLLDSAKINENPYKNILTSAIVGDQSEQKPNIEIKTLELEQNETFLICSDGVWEAMELESMEACFNEHNPIECLIEKVNISQDRDNFSIIVVEVKQ